MLNKKKRESHYDDNVIKKKGGSFKKKRFTCVGHGDFIGAFVVDKVFSQLNNYIKNNEISYLYKASHVKKLSQLCTNMVYIISNNYYEIL